MKKAPIILLAVILVGVAWLGFSRERKLPSISHVGKPVEQWIQELRDDDYAVRDSAEDALREMGEACVPYLIQSLGEKDSELKKAVMKLGGDFARSHFSPSEAHLNREAAAKALALMPEAGESAVLALAARLTDDYSPAAEEAQRALRLIGGRGVPIWIEALRDRDPEMRAAAAALLRDMGPASEETLAGLRVAASDEASKVRLQAVLTLRIDRGAAKTVAVLTTRLRDPDADVRAAAAESLAEIGPSALAAIEALEGALLDAETAVRIHVARALWRIDRRGRSALPALIGALRDERDGWRAVMVLAEMGEAAGPAIPFLVEALRKEPMHRPFRAPPAAAFALGRIGATAQPALIDALEDPALNVRAGAALALGLMGGSATNAISSLALTLDDEAEMVRHASAMSLISIGWNDRRLTPTLAEMLNADDDVVRFAAADSLKRIDPEMAWRLRDME